jgi:GABA(A) receptor-associated protein
MFGNYLQENVINKMTIDNSFKYQQKISFNIRCDESRKIRSRFPDRIPVIIEKYNYSKIEDIDKTKYLVPNDLSLAQLVYVIRKRIKLAPEKALFFFINGQIPTSSDLICNIYNTYKNDDGFLYIHYAEENTFG